MSDLKQELADLLAAEAEETAAALEAEAARKLPTQIAAAKKRAEARKAGLAFRELVTDAGSFILALPPGFAVVYQRFQDGEGASTEAVMQLVQPCVWPKSELATFTAHLEAAPAVLARAAKLVFELAGAQADEKAKK
jgi:hypothetical protein